MTLREKVLNLIEKDDDAEDEKKPSRLKRAIKKIAAGAAVVGVTAVAHRLGKRSGAAAAKRNMRKANIMQRRSVRQFGRWSAGVPQDKKTRDIGVSMAKSADSALRSAGRRLRERVIEKLGDYHTSMDGRKV